MPTSAPTPCRDCHHLGHWQQGRCPHCQHTHNRKRNTARGNRYGHAYRKARARLLANNPTCHWCGAPATTADHLTPASLGGTIAGNLVPACTHCNSARGNRPAPPRTF